tara:strand:- start:65 stop:736 length:672 start_codon:yes stop_codon:yes gene_type:complete
MKNFPSLDNIERLDISEDVRTDNNIFHKKFMWHGTDKATTHRYCRAYFTLFNDIKYNIKRFMEIGVLEGNSLAAWSELLPNAAIVGVENSKELERSHGNMLRESSNLFGLDQKDSKRISLRYYDSTSHAQARRERMNESNMFDIIVDDGDHNPYAQLATFYAHEELLKTGGTYIIEDMIGMYGVHVNRVIEEIKLNKTYTMTYYQSLANTKREVVMLILKKNG